jgi:hypothetical protein
MDGVPTKVLSLSKLIQGALVKRIKAMGIHEEYNNLKDFMECQLNGSGQIQVAPKIGLSYAAGLRSICLIPCINILKILKFKEFFAMSQIQRKFEKSFNYLEDIF